MKSTLLRTTAMVAGVVVLGAATLSFAQQPPAPRAPAAEARAKPDPQQFAERRAERLRATLQLRPEQEPALKAYLESLQPPAGLRDRMRGRRDEMAAMTTPQRLDAQKARVAERQAEFDRRAAATKRFYAQLSPAQQKAFDAIGPMRGGRAMGPGRGGHRGPFGPGAGPRAPG